MLQSKVLIPTSKSVSSLDGERIPKLSKKEELQDLNLSLELVLSDLD